MAGTVQPRIFCNNQGDMHLTWLENNGSKDVIALRSSTDRGLNWSSTAKNIHSQEARVSPYSDFKICGNDIGYIYGVWVDLRNDSKGDIYFNYSADHGQTFQEQDVRINTGPSGVSNPQIACNSQGYIYIAWVDTRSSVGGIYVNYSSDYGKTWLETDLRLDAPASTRSKVNCLPPQIVCSYNIAYVAWIEQKNDGSKIYNAGMYYNCSFNYGHTWQPTDIQLVPEGYTPSDLQVIWGIQSSSAYFAWIQEGKKAYFRDISKTANVQLPDGASTPFSDLRLAADSQGDIYVIWIGAGHLYETHCNISTQPTWRTPARRDNGSDSAVYDPSISCTSQGLASGQGLVALSWSQLRTNLNLGLNAFVNYSKDSGASWQNTPLNLETDDPPNASAFKSQVCCGGNPGGDIYAIWHDTNKHNVYFNSSINTDSKLDWTGQTGFTADGVNPDSAIGGSSFEFRVKYINSQNTAPATYQIWVDENDNGTYEYDEKYTMTRADSYSYSSGSVYAKSLILRYKPPTDDYPTDQRHKYRFYFIANNNIAIGTPAIDHLFTINPPTTSLPILRWTGTTGYTSDGVEPDVAAPGTTRVFQVSFTSYVAQDVRVQLWIDANDNGIYEGSEKYALSRQGSSDIYSYSKTVSYAGDGKISYRFFASDATSFATGDPTVDHQVLVNSVPVVCWTDDDGYVEYPGENLFTFEISYKDQDNDPPDEDHHHIWVDLNNDKKVQDEERYPLKQLDPNDDTDFSIGRIYTADVFLLYNGLTSVPIKFDFEDANNNTIASSSSCPAGYSPDGQSLTLQHDANSPVLAWTGEEGYKTGGVDLNTSPDGIGCTLTFRIMYTDYDGERPGPRYGTLLDPGYEVWVDANDNGTYEPSERFLMDEAWQSYQSNGAYTGIYTRSIYHIIAPLDGELNYRFFFHDGKNSATGNSAKAQSLFFNLASLQSMTNPATTEINRLVTFQVRYTSLDNKLPSLQYVWLDINDNKIIEENEKLVMDPVNFSDINCKDGKDYKRVMMINYAGDGELQYRFLFEHPVQGKVLGGPEEVHTIAVTAPSHPAPTLTWTSGYPNGVNTSKGHSGDMFTFQVRYQNLDPNTDSCSCVRHQLWLDLDDDGEYEVNEKIDPNVVNNGVYTFHKVINLPQGGEVSYGFAFNNCYRAATGQPATTGQPALDKSITIDRPPKLEQGTVTPNPGDGGSTFQFQATYKDEDNDPPSTSGFVWVDLNRDTLKQDIEKFPLREKDPNQKSYQDGKVYQASTRMIFFDPNLSTTGDPSTSNNLAYQFFQADANTSAGIVTVKKVGNAPVLTYGTIPSSGNANDWFTFKVIYTDLDGDSPSVCQVWVDENDDGVYQSTEKWTMLPENVADKNYKNGVIYTQIVYLSAASQSQVSYRFYFHDGKNLASGPPTHDRFLFLNHQPTLESPKVTPVQGEGGSGFTFQVTYRDLDNDPPQLHAEVWVDENGNGTYEPNEQYPMGQKDTNKEFKDGVCYEQSNIKLHYAVTADISTLFYFSDLPGSEVKIQGPKLRVTRSGSQPVLSWVNEIGYQQDGVNPDSSVSDADFTFKVLYKDADGDAPDKIELWVDPNTDSTHAAATKYTLSSSSSDSFDKGRIYSFTHRFTHGSGDGVYIYWFRATDGKNTAVGTPTTGGKFYICDGSTGDGGPRKWYYRDKDEDGYGSSSYPKSMSVCAVHTDSGYTYVENSLDCNDNNPNVNPGASEIHCDGLNNDCDSTTLDNNPPQLEFIPPQVVMAGDSVTLCPQAYDEDAVDSVNFIYSGWMTSNSRTTDQNDVGTHWVTVTASDNCNYSSTGDRTQSTQTVMIAVIGLGTIQGTVTNKETGVSVPNIAVRIQGMSNNKYTAELRTGSYKLSKLLPGQYSLIVSAPDYQRLITKVSVSSSQTVDHHVKLLPHAAKIAGKVFEVKNSTEVSLRDITVTATSLTMGIPSYTAQTDSDGNYYLYLPTGTFKLAAVDPNCLFKPTVENNSGNGFKVDTNPDSSAHSLNIQSNSKLKLKMVRNSTMPYLPSLRVTSVEKWETSDPDRPELITNLFFYPQGPELLQISLGPDPDPNFANVIGSFSDPIFIDDGSSSGHYEAVYDSYYGYSTTISCIGLQCTATYASYAPQTFSYRFIIHPQSNSTLSPLFPISRSEIRTTSAEGGYLPSIGYLDEAGDPNRVFDYSRVEIPPYGVYPVKTDATQDALPLRVCLERRANTFGDDVVSWIYNLQVREPLTTARSQDATTSWARLNPNNPVIACIQVDMSRMLKDQDSTELETRYQDPNSTILDDIEVRYLDDSSSVWKIDGIDDLRLDNQYQNNDDDLTMMAQRYFMVAVSLQHSGSLAVFQVTPNNLYASFPNDTTIELHWQDRSLSEKGFEIWRKDKSADGEFVLLAKTSTDTKVYSDQGLKPITTYQYKVRAIRSLTDAKRFSSFSNTIEVITGDPGKGTGGSSGGGGGGSCFISAIRSAVMSVIRAVIMPGSREQVKWWAW